MITRIKTIEDILIQIEDKYHLTQVQLAKRMDITPPYLSAVKNGSKKRPKAWLKRIPELFPDLEISRDELNNAFNLSKNEIRFPIDGESYAKKVMALNVANNFKKITDEQADKISEIIL